MKCIKCGWDNAPRSLKCEECNTLLPQTDNLSVKDALGGLLSDDMAETPRGAFTPMLKVEEAMGQLLDESITPGEFRTRVECAVAPLKEMMARIAAMDPDLRNFAANGMTIVEEAYDNFNIAMDDIIAGVDSDDDDMMEKGFRNAREAVEAFRNALPVITGELRKAEEDYEQTRK